MAKILTVVGARPQFVKSAALSRALSKRPSSTEILVHTGQHFDFQMSDVFFRELGIPKPNHFLGIGGGTHGAMTGRQLEAIETVLLKEKPDVVVVFGDTNSTLAASLAAVKLHIPIAHVEAGLRSFNRKMPEEINRILTDHASDILFASTEIAQKNLETEGIQENKVHNVGDIMFDVSKHYRKQARKPDWFDTLASSETGFVLATLHRAENVDDPKKLSDALEGLGKSTCPVILPLHPRTKSRMSEYGISTNDTIKLVDPVGYLEMIWLQMNCKLFATDSGGMQKEAYFFKKPCLTLREETEWEELVDSGWNNLVGTDPEKITKYLESSTPPKTDTNFYGDGTAAEKIADVLSELVN